jgi:phosphatidyl-myo-inositol alpha-mannosyltransferase
LHLRVASRWLGRVSEEDKPRLFKAADVYCAPNLRGESFGIVLLEAMATATPTVCSDLAGFRAVAGGAAELVPVADPGALADALRKVLTDERVATRMRATGGRLASRFDWDRLVPQVEAIYKRALARDRKA